MPARKLSHDEILERRKLDRERDRFMAVLEGLGWVSLIGFCLFFAHQCGLV